MLIQIEAFRDYDPESGCQNFVDPMYPDPDPNLKITFFTQKKKANIFDNIFKERNLKV